jgi:hypothetical protein
MFILLSFTFLLLQIREQEAELVLWGGIGSVEGKIGSVRRGRWWERR